MNEHNFTEKDKENLIEFLNFIGKKAKFEIDTQECIRFFGLLNFMQKQLLPKVDSHILEVKRIIENKEEDKK